MTHKRDTDKGSQSGHRITHPLTPRLLPLKEAAKYLGLSTWSMRVPVEVVQETPWVVCSGSHSRADYALMGQGRRDNL